MDTDRLEEIAGDLLRAVEAHPPISAFALADACGLTLVTTGCRIAAVRGAALIYNARHPQRLQEQTIAIHLAHWRLSRCGEKTSDEAVRYVARALLLPRAQFETDLRRTTEISELQRRHYYASEAFIEERIADCQAQDAHARLQLVVA